MIATQTHIMPICCEAPPACPACRDPGCRQLRTLDVPGHPGPFRLWRCRGCGFVFHHPKLTPQEIREQYDGEYYVFHESPERRWARAAQLYVEHLLPLEQRSQGRTLLEIGCAGGELLALARDRGWQVTGIEISPQASQAARRNHDLDVRAGTLEEHANTIGGFDVAIANDVIEHIAAPGTFLRTLHDVLRPGGWATLETPNWGGIWRRLGGRRWLGINPFHISFFDARALLRLMGECGFRDCRAGSSTNLAYASWGARPELTSMIDRLPAWLAWRCARWADRLTPASAALCLHRRPPASLDSALACVAQADPHRFRVSDNLRGDNLTVIGRA